MSTCCRCCQYALASAHMHTQIDLQHTKRTILARIFLLVAYCRSTVDANEQPLHQLYMLQPDSKCNAVHVRNNSSSIGRDSVEVQDHIEYAPRTCFKFCEFDSSRRGGIRFPERLPALLNVPFLCTVPYSLVKQYSWRESNR